MYILYHGIPVTFLMAVVLMDGIASVSAVYSSMCDFRVTFQGFAWRYNGKILHWVLANVIYCLLYIHLIPSAMCVCGSVILI